MDMILNAILVARNVLMHSIRTAWFCWVAVGLVVSVLIIRGVARKKGGRKQDNNDNMEEMK